MLELAHSQDSTLVSGNWQLAEKGLVWNWHKNNALQSKIGKKAWFCMLVEESLAGNFFPYSAAVAGWPCTVTKVSLFAAVVVRPPPESWLCPLPFAECINHSESTGKICPARKVGWGQCLQLSKVGAARCDVEGQVLSARLLLCEMSPAWSDKWEHRQSDKSD